MVGDDSLCGGGRWCAVVMEDGPPCDGEVSLLLDGGGCPTQ